MKPKFAFQEDVLERLACANTRHISPKDLLLLGQKGTPVLATDGNDAVFVRVNDLEEMVSVDDIRAFGYSEEFIVLMVAADDADCSLLELDWLGLIYDGLPVFEHGV